MASEPSTSTEGAETSADQLNVNLQVVSPSVGVNRPLVFPGLPASTTIKQLKDKIRQSLPLRPADENQRLIHRGRALVRETDSLLDIFGADSLRVPDQQTIHLVIRDAHDSQTSTPPAPASNPSPAAPPPAANIPRPQGGQQTPFATQAQAGFTRRTPLQYTSNTYPQPRMPSPSAAHTPEQAAAFQHQHQNMTQWLSHLRNEAMARAIVTQNQRTRAQMGMRGIGDPAGTATQNHGDNQGRASPAPPHTVYREHIGPNGQTYQFETIIRNPAPGPSNGGMSPVDVQNILRGADASQATATMTNAMRRSASSASLHSLHNRTLNQPGVTTSIFANPSSRTGSGRGTPDPNSAPRSVSGGSNTLAPGSQSSQPRQGLEVYILSSPEGPRALLMNNTNSETFYTPRLRTRASHPQLRYPTANGNTIPLSQYQQMQYHLQAQQRQQLHQQTLQPQLHLQQQQQQQQHQHYPQQHQHQEQQQQPPHQAQQQPQVQFQNPGDGQNQPQLPIGGMMHHGNPPAAALPPLLMRLWPQLWLLFRLALFVWFFTSPNASWSRWLTIICVAVFIFVLSTGVLNGFADHVWRPLGRHLENLIPPLDQPNHQQNGNDNRREGHRRDPDPADMAARLVAEQRQHESWLVSQARRLERATLLFLASIAPGVAERHIAHLEAEARAERERLEAARVEAERRANEEAAEAERQREQDNNQEGQPRAEMQGSEQALDEGRVEGEHQDEPAQEQLIAI